MKKWRLSGLSHMRQWPSRNPVIPAFRPPCSQVDISLRVEQAGTSQVQP